MRLNVYIAAALCWMTTEAAPRFTDPVWRPDLGIAVPGLVRGTARPFSLPKAEGYLVTSGKGERSLEDRFDVYDLWEAATLRGRWVDGEGNQLQIARLFARPPTDAPGTVCTEFPQPQGLDLPEKTVWLRADTGEPFDPAHALGPEAGHFGLAGMRERAKRADIGLSFVHEGRWMILRLAVHG